MQIVLINVIIILDAKYKVRYGQFLILFLCVCISTVSSISAIVTIIAMTDYSIHKENIQVI